MFLRKLLNISLPTSNVHLSFEEHIRQYRENSTMNRWRASSGSVVRIAFPNYLIIHNYPQARVARCKLKGNSTNFKR